MREIMAGTEEGKKVVKEIAKKVKSELNEEEFNEAMTEINSTEKEVFGIDELLGMGGEEDDDDDVFGIDEMF
jgi:hypothetical protein